MKKVCCILLVLLSFIILTACSGSKGKMISMNIDYVKNSEGKSVKRMDGQAQEFFNVTKEKAQIVKVSVTKESGDINIKIFKSKDQSNVIYEGHDFTDQPFTVNVKEAGKYTILVTCTKFIGDYKLEYDLSI